MTGVISTDCLGKYVFPAETWNPVRAAVAEEFRYIDLSSIDNGAKRITGHQLLLGSDAPSRARQLVKSGDVLVSTVRPNLNGVARVPIELDGATASTGFCILRPDRKRLWPDYLFQWVKSPPFIQHMIRKATGASYPAVSDRIILASDIPLPSLSQQKRIAAILDEADELRRLRQRAVQQLNDLDQAIFYNMFGDPLTNPSNWPVVKCEELCTRITVGVVVRPASYYKDTGVPALRGTNIKPEGIDLSDMVYFSEEDSTGALSKSQLRTDDIVVVRSGRPGLAAIIPEHLDGSQAIDIIIATPDKSLVRPLFLKSLINSAGGKAIILSESRGQVQQHFNVGSLSAARVIQPPLELQVEFERRLLAIGHSLRPMAMAKDRLDALFTSLQHRAFSGGL